MVLVSLRLRSSAGVRMSVTIVEVQDDLLSFVAEAEHQLRGLLWDLEDEAAGYRATRWDRSAIEGVAARRGPGAPSPLRRRSRPPAPRSPLGPGRRGCRISRYPLGSFRYRADRGSV